jgi:type II secretory ATPase GspE/PulE/Tfp pilus assembly ATPase PilB-like protein
MPDTFAASDAVAAPLREQLASLDPAQPQYATDLVDHLLAAGRAADASDIHLQPFADGLDVRWRIDGVLQHVVRLPQRAAPNVIGRLKVLAGLLTYRNDAPQEGRMRSSPSELEVRVSTFPTLYGEKAVVRLLADRARQFDLDGLGFAAEMAADVCWRKRRAPFSSPGPPAAAKQQRSMLVCAKSSLKPPAAAVLLRSKIRSRRR